LLHLNTSAKTVTLDALTFDNRFTNQLPADPIAVNSRRQVQKACYSRVLPTEVAAPELVAYSREVAAMLGLDEATCRSSEFADIFAGNKVLPGMDPFAMCYGGHQFGNWAGQLGDGRAINLGEARNAGNEHWTLQLKGAGPTPYSRTADGLAVLRSSVREFLCSEAMHHLGVPTTRALSLILSGEKVRRDMFYDGNPQLEPGAIVCRVAKSFTRFGNFQIFAARQDIETLRTLVDFTIRNDFPHLIDNNTHANDEPVANEIVFHWFREVCTKTAEMIVHWQRVGFVHGVMNTDNMSILGLTIDYGPYGWLEDYNPDWTPNTTDASGRRYRFGNQPTVAHWNLYQLANAIVQLTEEPGPLEDSLQLYADTFNKGYFSMMAAKLGLSGFVPETDEPLINDLLKTLQLTETDMTIFFRNLKNVPANASDADGETLLEPLKEAYYKPGELAGDTLKATIDWLKRYSQRLASNELSDQQRGTLMDSVNPKYVLRNYMAQLAIDKAEQGDHSMVNALLDLLRHPYDEQPEHEETFFAKRPEWARERAGCSMLSCSS
jgi:serine/tyrosine/threonine adenylyltransferase